MLENDEGHRLAWHALRTLSPLDPQQVPMLERVVRASLGIVVHSPYMRKRVLEAYPAARVAMIPHLDLSVRRLETVTRDSARAALGLDPRSRILGVFGYVAPTKRIGVLLQAIRQLSPDYPDLRLICVGQRVPGYDPLEMAAELDLKERVEVTGYVPLEKLELYLRAIDIGINLRYPTWGESSGALFRMMAAERPVIVSDAGSFRGSGG